MGLDALVAGVVNSMGIERQRIRQATEACFEFLAEGGNAFAAEQNHSTTVLEDKLRLFLYVTEKVPIAMREGKKRIANIHDLGLLRYASFNFHTEKAAEVRDDEFYRLLMRIARRHSRKKGPSLDDLINEMGLHPLTVRHFGRSVSYDDVLSTRQVLLKYMTGQQEIIIQRNGKRRRIKIRSPEDLWVLRAYSEVQSGVDEHLLSLWRRVFTDYKYGRGPSWRDLIGEVGQSTPVVRYLGRSVTYGDVSFPTPESDRQLLFRYLTGQIPIHSEEGKVVPSSLEDLHVFMVYKGGKEYHSDEDLLRLFHRMRSRKTRGEDKGTKQLFNEVGRRPAVKQRYGRAVTYRDVVLQSLVHSYAIALETFMLGEVEVKVGGLAKRISSIQDMQFLRPDWQFADQEVKGLRMQIQRHTPETGVSFYDLVDRVGARQEVVEKYERAITRFDVNPNIGRYEGRRVYARPDAAAIT